MSIVKRNIIAIIVALFLIILVIWAIYKQINDHYLIDDSKLKEIKNVFEDFFSQENYWTSPLDMLNDRDVMKEIKIYRGEKSYTINKERVYLCLKDEKGEYYTDNMLIFVFAHEIAHVLCDEIGHTEKFHIIFEELIAKLTDAEFYNPSIPIDKQYCMNGDPEL